MSLNGELSEIFRVMAAIMDIRGENAFKAISFSRVSRLIADYPQDLRDVVNAGKLADIQGIGPGSKKVIEEYVATGRSTDYEQVLTSVPNGLLGMLEIPGMGPKTVALLWKQRGITSIEELAKGIEEGKLEGLKGIGEKKIDQIKQGIALRSQAAARMGILEAQVIADSLLARLRDLPGVKRAEIAGSLRRRKETVGDVDFVSCLKKGADPAAIGEAFSKFPEVTKILGQGTTKTSVLTVGGLQVDLRIVPGDNFGAALMYFTGSKDHNVKLRGLAQDKGMTLNEWGLYSLKEYDKAKKKVGEAPDVKPVASATEEEVYRALGLAWIEPELREDRGEVEAAQSAPVLRGPIEDRVDFRDLRLKYLGRMLTEFSWVVTEDDMGGRLDKEGMEMLELALVLAYPDSEPRHGMPSKRGNEAAVPRFNAWDPRYERFGLDPKSALLSVHDAIASNPRLSSLYAACVQTADGKGNSWFKSGSLRGANVPDRQGIYFFRNKQTGRVNEGYVGLAGAGTANTLRSRLGMHFSGDWTSDNMLKRYVAEEENATGRTRAGSLPRLITVADIRSDLHTHTKASDGSNTIEEMAEAAKARGYEVLAITDHSKSQVIANGLTAERLLKHVEAIHKAASKITGITLLAGCEVDILVDGRLDFDDDILKELDWVVASPHASLRQDTEKATARIVRAIENRYVNVIGHPTGRLINRREGLALDFSRIFQAAARTGTALEINAGYPRLDLNDVNARGALAAGCVLSINTDAHSTPEFDGIAAGVSVARRAWAQPQSVINTWPVKDLLAWVKNKRG